MNNLEKLIGYLESKQKIIKEKTGIDYIDHVDLEYIKNLSDEEINFICWTVTIKGDESNCPWCILRAINLDKCLYCNYGQRHGYCMDEASARYNLIRNKLGIAIVTLPKIQKVFKEYFGEKND